MKKTILILLFILVTFTCAGASELFRFKYKTGQQFYIEGYVEEEIYQNDILIKSVRIKNIGELIVKSIHDNKALHEGLFRYYTSGLTSEDFILKKEYSTRFYRDIYGNYEIEDVYFMPIVRGVPTFPVTPVEIGDQWRGRAFEAHDFRDGYGITKPVILPASVSYQYLGNIDIKGEKIAKLSINYVINYTLKYAWNTTGELTLPFRVIGYFNQLYLWNLTKGVPHSYKENFDYIFILTNGETVEYMGKSNATLKVTQEITESELLLQNIRNMLEKEMPYVEVSINDQGIVINIGEILFKFDSDELTEGASHDLDNIVELLNDFPDRKIRVIGHTDSTGPEDYNLSLSLRRAKRTAQELKDRMPEKKSDITYLGMGESKPIASNETEEGRRKNRRVEIIILN